VLSPHKLPAGRSSAGQTWRTKVSEEDTEKDDLGVDQTEPLLDPQNTSIKPVDAHRQIRILMLEDAEPAFDVLHIFAQAINRAADVAQMFEDDAFNLGHARRVSQVL